MSKLEHVKSKSVSQCHRQLEQKSELFPVGRNGVQIRLVPALINAAQETLHSVKSPRLLSLRSSCSIRCRQDRWHDVFLPEERQEE